MKNHRKPVISVLGSGGGAARAVLAILNRSAIDGKDPIHSYIRNCEIHLVDRNQKEREFFKNLCPNLENKLVLHQFDLNDTNRFKKHLASTETALVIDVSWADTVKMLESCDDLGVLYVNSALENTEVDQNEDFEGFALIERYRRFEEKRKNFSNTSAIVCSGMNPGVVQWMALELMKKMPRQKPKGCYIVEIDDSFYADRSVARTDTIYVSWSVECFLDEAILSYPMFVKHRIPHFLYNHVYELEFKVTLEDKEFYGCLMPHEETLTLGKLYDMEVGFIYKVNDHTTKVLRENLQNADDLWNWKHKVLDPNDAKLKGKDLVGVLLVYEDKELFLYNEMSNAGVFAKYKTNATYFQVACGIYAAVSSLLLDNLPRGVYYVDKLLLETKSKYGEYLTYYMEQFVCGQNKRSDGLLHERMRQFNDKKTK